MPKIPKTTTKAKKDIVASQPKGDVKPKGKIGAMEEKLKPRYNGKHPGGRPPKFNDAATLQEAIDAYFESCWEDKVTEVNDNGVCTMSTVRYQQRPYTVAGLSVGLDITRDTLCEYAKNGEFSDIVKKAKNKIEACVEEIMMSGKNPAGAIFWLKNHAGYRDKQEMEHSGPEGGPIIIEVKFGKD